MQLFGSTTLAEAISLPHVVHSQQPSESWAMQGVTESVLLYVKATQNRLVRVELLWHCVLREVTVAIHGRKRLARSRKGEIVPSTTISSVLLCITAA